MVHKTTVCFQSLLFIGYNKLFKHVFTQREEQWAFSDPHKPLLFFNQKDEKRLNVFLRNAIHAI